MLMLMLALAVMPQPIGRPMPGDLGLEATLVGETRAAATRIEVTVDASGRPVHCAVVTSDGMGRLDRAACRQMMTLARFTPARGFDNEPVAAVIRQDFTVNQIATLRRWNGPADGARRIDFALPVAGLPAADADPAAELMVMTDAGGRVTRCAVVTSAGRAQLDHLACRQMADASFTPARDAGGTAIAALRQVSIGFTTGPVPR